MAEKPTQELLVGTFVEIFKQTDRASAIVSCSLLDELLERLLLAFFMEHGNAKKDLFGVMKPLSTMSAKTDIAYHMGLIKKDIFEDLHRIRKVRNDFAHSFEVIDFETPHIKDKCEQLKTIDISKLPKEVGYSINSTKHTFYNSSIGLAVELLFRIHRIKRLKPFQLKEEVA